MAFEEKTGLDNAKSFKFEKAGDSIEGFYLRTTDEIINGQKVKKSVFQTAEGLVSVLGQANMLYKLKDGCLNTLVRVSYTGKTEKPPGAKFPMKVFKVEADHSQVLEAGTSAVSEDELGDTGLVEDDVPHDEATAPRATLPKRIASAPSAAAQAKVQELLRRSK